MSFKRKPHVSFQQRVVRFLEDVVDARRAKAVGEQARDGGLVEVLPFVVLMHHVAKDRVGDVGESGVADVVQQGGRLTFDAFAGAAHQQHGARSD
jgi:hypothetical protein